MQYSLQPSGIEEKVLATMNCLQLHFDSSHSYPELNRTCFSFRSRPTRLCHRGRVILASELSNSFTWTAGVRALCYLFVQTKASWLQLGSPPFILEGVQGSMASSLDLAIAKRTRWLCDMFGVEDSGILVVRRLINIDNPERKRVGPVRLCINRSQLEPQDIKIYLDQEELEDSSQVQDLANLLLLASLDQREKESSSTANSPDTAKSEQLLDATNSGLRFMADVFHESKVQCDYWAEWVPLLQGVIRGLKSSLSGTISSAELHRWWFSRIGTSYLVQNCALLARSGTIRRIILLDPSNPQFTRGGLLQAYVQKALGVDVRVCEDWNAFKERIPGRPDYLSVFDDEFSLQVYGEMEERIAHLSSVSPRLDQQLYDSVFFDDCLCHGLNDFVEKENLSFTERAQADNQIQVIRDIFTKRNGSFSGVL